MSNSETQAATVLRERRLAVAAVVLCVALWTPTLGLGPLSDDFQRIGEAGGGLEHQLLWFTEPVPGVAPPLPEAVSPKLYRPVWRLVFALQRWLLPAGWEAVRAVALGMHGLAIASLWALLRSLRLKPELCGVAAVLFGISAWQAEAVGWVSAQGVGLALAFVFLAGTWRARPRLAFAALLLAGATRESALLAPALALCWTRLDEDRRLRGLAVAALGVSLGFLAMRMYLFDTPVGGYTTEPFWWQRPDGPVRLADHVAGALSPLPGTVLGGAGLVVGLGFTAVLGGLALWGTARRAAVGCLAWLAVANLPYQRVMGSGLHGDQGRFFAESAAPLGLLWALGIWSLPKTARGPVAAVAIAVVGAGALQRQSQLAAAVAEGEAVRAAIATLPMDGGTLAVPRLHLGFPLRPGLWPWAGMSPWTAEGSLAWVLVEPRSDRPTTFAWCGAAEGICPPSGEAAR
jgi:hypothetical protein